MAIDEDDLELDTESGTGKKKGKSSLVKIVIISVVVLLVMGITIGATMYLVGGSEDASAAEDMAAGEGESAKKKQKDKPVRKDSGDIIYHAFEPAFVVNFEDKGVVRFLQIGLSVMTHNEDVVADLQQHEPVIRNNLVLMLSSQKYEDLTSREGKEKLRAMIRDEIRSILRKYTGDPGIEEAFFTSFVIQ